jgi:alpha-tubulin suppressor-like RCC1 family protein
LGYGNTTYLGDTPATLPSTASNVNLGGKAIQLATGTYDTCALLESNALRCWGANGYGELGYGSTNNIGDNELPVDSGDVPIGGAVAQVSAAVGSPNGVEHVCAFLKSGSLRCWGSNGLGQLGYGNTTTVGNTSTSTPAAVGNVQFQ